MDAQVDSLQFGAGGLSGAGNVAQRLIANGMNVHALRPYIADNGKCYMSVNQGGTLKPQLVNNATLRFVEWKQYDEAIIREARVRLAAVADLQARGLVYNVTNGMGKTVLESENLGEFNPAEISMDGLSRTQGDRPTFGTNYLPLPIVHKDYFINARVLAVSRNVGDPLDTTSAELATRQVVEKMEDMLVNGCSEYAFGGGTIYGYTDFPQRHQMDLDAHWDASGMSPDDVVQDVLAMKQALINDRMYGPYMLYVPTCYETLLDKDYVPVGGTTTNKTLRQRLLDIANVSGLMILDKLPAHNVLLVQLSSDVVRIVNGMEIAPVEWQEQGGMVLHYKVMGIKVPQIRATQAGRCGIIHLRPHP